MSKRLRLLPIVLFVGALMLTIRAGDLWSDLSVTAGAVSSAEPAAGGTQADLASPAPEAAPDATEEPPASEVAEAGSADAAPDMMASEPAESVAPADVSQASTEELAPEIASAGEAAAAADPFGFTDEELDVLQSLAKRREQLDGQERALQQREALLQAAEQRMDQKLTELRLLQETISGLMEQHDVQAQAQIDSLVKIYENMKPKDAARIFEQLEMDVLLDVVGGMKEQKVAAVLAEVDPMRAKDITLELSERRSLPIPTE